MRPVPDVSVVMPVFNRAELVGFAVECALRQETELGVEVVVVDDGSTDGTRKALDRYGDRIVRESFPSNRGRNHARNAGLALAMGEWVKFLDSDDVLEPGALRAEVSAGRDSAADVVISSWRCASRSGGASVTHAAPPFRDGVDSLLAGEAVPTSAALYRRAWIAELRWDVGLRKLDDWDFFVRACLGGAKVVSAPVVSYTWVSHPGQGVRTSSLLENAREFYVVLEKLEERLREDGTLTPGRARRLAQYLYKELRVLCLEDRGRFEEIAQRIKDLDARFAPRDEERQAWMARLSAVIGFRRAVLCHTAAKRVFRGVRGTPDGSSQRAGIPT